MEIQIEEATGPTYLNILDLGFFHSLKAHIPGIKRHANSIPQIIEKVGESFNSYDAHTLDNIWGHGFTQFNEILRCDVTT
jgi:hypothetical protein